MRHRASTATGLNARALTITGFQARASGERTILIFVAGGGAGQGAAAAGLGPDEGGVLQDVRFVISKVHADNPSTKVNTSNRV